MRWIKWCALCEEREVNGRLSDECARCQGIIAEALRLLEVEVNGG